MILAEGCVPPYRLRTCASPLVVSMPHAGTWIPHRVGSGMADAACARQDTDWHLERLYDFLDALGATTIVATHSRYFVDLNRPSDDASLYPGQVSTGLCPTQAFDGTPLYREAGPDEAEKARRVEAVWKPYHARLASELARAKAEHGVAILWEAHSIASEVPRLFEGRLPDFNLGTTDGASCDPSLAQALHAALRKRAGFTSVLNGRFKGGYNTRHFGRPAEGAHAVQMEMVTALYMDERPPFGFREDLAARVRPILREQLETALDWAYRARPR